MLPAADFRKEFIAFCVAHGVLKFGRFVTKSGRTTPYFFNAGLFNTGASLEHLAQFYAKAILASRLSFDMPFGPAHNGIVLAAGAAIALSRERRGRIGVGAAGAAAYVQVRRRQGQDLLHADTAARVPRSRYQGDEQVRHDDTQGSPRGSLDAGTAVGARSRPQEKAGRGGKGEGGAAQ